MPPACCTLALADSLAPWTRSVSRVVSDPSPSSLTLPAASSIRPSALSRSGVTRSPSEQTSSCRTLTTWGGCGRPVAFCLNPRLGNRRISGVRPPSKPGRLPEPVLARCPFWPRVAVLPCPHPIPRPTRFRRCRAPGTAGMPDTFILTMRIADCGMRNEEPSQSEIDNPKSAMCSVGVAVSCCLNDGGAPLADLLGVLKGLQPLQRRLHEV